MGYPMLLPTLDVETRSHANLKTAGAYKYAEHPSTEFISIAYCLDPEALVKEFESWTPGSSLDDLHEHISLWTPGDPDPEELLAHIELGGLLEAHNAYFEYCIWHFVAHGKLGWPDVELDQWRCSKAKAQSNGLPGKLDKLTKALRLSIEKDPRGEALIKKLSSPDKKTGAFCEDIQLKQDMYAYNKTDVLSELEASRNMPEMPKEEIEIWKLDQKINHRGVRVDVESVLSTIEILNDTKHLTDRLPELSEGAFKTPGQRDKILDWCASKGVVLPGFTAADVAEALAKDLPEDVREVLQIRRTLGKSSTKKYQKMLDRLASDGRIHEVGVYHRAHTGRWGGAGVQVQNLPRPTVYPPKDNPNLLVELLQTGSREAVEAHYPSAFEVAASSIRSMVVPAPDHDFISADYSAIEARVIFWLAHDEGTLEVFRQGGCIYCKNAAGIYREDYDELYKAYKSGDPRAEDKRSMGKLASLGLQYQMGVDRFMSSCAAKGVELDKETVEDMVSTFRTYYKKLPKFWRKLEECAINAVENRGRVFKTSKSRRAIQFKADGIFLLARLPSGRCLHYAYPKVEKIKTSWGSIKKALTYENVKEGKWCRSTTYGGKLAENVTQAVARDVLRDAMLKIEAAGYPIVMTVHDEILAEVPESFGSIKHFEDIMCDSNPWAAGLPLAAEGWRGKRYRK